jgi:colicin import membrane protein
MKPLLALAFALLAAAGAHAAQDPQDQAERDRIKAERAAVETQFNAEQKACRAKFAETDCVQKAQRDRHAALADLRRQERVLNDAERKRRAGERQ